MKLPALVSTLIGVPHGFFGRAGGVSSAPFDTLNASLTSGDAEDAVEQNRDRVARALGAAQVLTARQVHSARAVLVSEPFAAAERPEADALVTRVPGLAIGALAADCVPVLIEGPGLVAAIHAGWRGSLAGIVGSTVELLAREGAARTDLRAAIGPCLRRGSFEVRADLVDRVVARHPDAERHFTGCAPGQWLYDHVAFIVDRLLEAGLPREGIDDVGGDTLSESQRFFSYRGAQRAGLRSFGHNISAIALPAG